MPIPTHEEAMLPLLRLAQEQAASLDDAVDRIAQQFQLSEADLEETISSGTQTLVRNRCSWAVTYMTKAGLVERPQRGIFQITKAGKTLLNRNPSHIDKKMLTAYPGFRTFLKKSNKPQQNESETQNVAEETDVDTLTPDERISEANSEIEAALKSDLLDRILGMSPDFFERLIVELLVAMGYGGPDPQAGRHLGKSGDGGVDGVINEDKLGLDQVYLQAKRYAPQNGVGRPDIQRFAGSLMGFGAHKGVFVTTSFFTKPAVEYAHHNVAKRIILIDGEQLTDLMLEYKVGIRVHKVVELKKIDEDFFHHTDQL